MRKVRLSFAIICICFLVMGCHNLQEKDKGEPNMSNKELYDIYFLFEAPKATEKHELSEVIKIAFSVGGSSNDNEIAIDIEKHIIHIAPWMSTLGVTSLGESDYIEDIEKVLNILEKYNVQDWKEDYTFEDPSSYEDGFAWSLYLQFEDGTVERHKGSGSFAEEITPDNFNEFYNELNDFVEERLEE